MGKKLIDDTILMEMLNEGKLQKEIAAHLHVSPVAICKRLKRLVPQPESVLDKYNLTDQQKAFVIEKAKGKSNTAAALTAYNAGSVQSAKVIGSQLMDKPEVQNASAELRACGLNHHYRANRIKQHVDNRDPNISLKALDMSFRLDGSYAPEKHDVRATTFDMKIDRERYLLYLENKLTRVKEDDPQEIDGE